MKRSRIAHLTSNMCKVGGQVRRRRSFISVLMIGAFCTIVNPSHVTASPKNSIVTPNPIPNYFYLTPQELNDLIIRSIQELHRGMPIQDLRVHSRQYDVGSECDHLFFTFISDGRLYLGLGELRESRVQDAKLVARTLIGEVRSANPFSIVYAFSPCLPSVAGKVNDASIVRVDMIEGNGRVTMIAVRNGFFFQVFDHGINIYEFQRVRFDAVDVNNHVVASINGSDLYPRHH